jgi:Cdc6-like AAA superfamily ATPase
MIDDNELNQIMSSSPHVQQKAKVVAGLPPAYPYEMGIVDIDEEIEKGYCQWSTADNIIFKPTSQTCEKLIPGVYEIDMSPNVGLFFEKIPVRTEGLIRFPDSNSDAVIEEISKFWDREEIFKQHELIYKRGILLWGPPGSGKSCILQLIMSDVVDRGGIVIRFDDPDLFLDGMRAVRKIQPDTPVVVIMEDIDSIIKEYSESEVLNILDGVNEVHKVVFLATTNYPDHLGKRIVNRPSRFDKRFKIGMPNKASRKIYFEHLFEKVSPEEKIRLNLNAEQWAKDMNELSMAHMKELFVAVCILGDDYKKAVETLQNMKEDINDDEGNSWFWIWL